MFNCSWLFVRVHVPRPAVHVTKPLSRFQSNTYLNINMSCSCSATEVDFVELNYQGSVKTTNLWTPRRAPCGAQIASAPNGASPSPPVARQEGHALASASSRASTSTSSAEGDGNCMDHACPCVLVSHLAAAALRFGRSGGWCYVSFVCFVG